MPEIKPLKEFPHYASILAFWAYREWYRNRSIDFNIIVRAYQDRINTDRLPVSWIALKNSMPVGMVSLKENDLWSRNDLNPWLTSLFILPEYRKSGIGKRLIKTVIDAAASLNYENLYLFTAGNNIKLNDYYLKIGWYYLENAYGNDNDTVKILYYNIA
ncbi:MAG: GNAT family N-acetyltransferase [Spirochaetes bacterium]|nr:GNAT family N-acetyltransferase [Spirochaetota bacterium]